MAEWALPDFSTYPVEHLVVSAEPVAGGVRVTWSDGMITEHHRFVLREHSPDPATTHPLSREQQLQLSEIDESLTIVAAHPGPAGGLVVEWGNDELLAQSTYHPGWLRAWSAGSEGPSRLPDLDAWDVSLDLDTLTFAGPSVLDGGRDFENALRALHCHGLALIRGLPAEAKATTRFPSMIGPVRDTNFGHVFDVRTKADDVTSNAYTDLELPVHTDLDTREYMPGLQFLHCVINDAEGGASRLSDGLAITRHLRDEHPDAFDALTTIPVAFVSKARDSDYRHTAPFLVVDDDGDLVEARWSPWLRGPLQASISDAERFYAALRLALRLGDSADFVVEHRLASGELLAFDNRRILHGREALDRRTGDRWLRGCYVEREELHSRLRVLAR